MIPDSQLLRQYADHHDNAAFAELVRRHVDLVYSVALRQTNGDAHLAQDVTQAVFTDLARKARPLSGRETLAGWLHTSARFAVGNAIRSEARRRAREHEAATMHEITSAPDINWEHLRPLLDDSVGQLKETDRDAIVLRFFEGKSHEKIGEILGLSKNSANKRVERALDKLREHFARRGVKASSALLATAMAENSVQAAPVELAASVTSASLTGAVAAGITGAPSGTFLRTLFMDVKIKIVLAAILILAVAALVLYRWPASNQSSTNLGLNASLSGKTNASKPVAQFSPAVAPPVLKPVPASAQSASASTNSGAEPSDNAKNNIHNIAEAYLAYVAEKDFKANVSGGVLSVKPGDTAHEAAYLLAAKAYENQASIYFVPGDPLGPKQPPKVIVEGDINIYPMTQAFASATLSVEMVANLPPDAPGTTPVVWTRGLQDDGTWAADSPYLGRGGYIGFLNGKVVWYDRSAGGSLMSYSADPRGRLPTSNIHDALPPGAVILSAKPTVSSKPAPIGGN